MKILETVLHFITLLARIIFPAGKRKSGKPCASPTATDPLSDGHHPPLPPDPGDGSDADSHRSDSLPDFQGHPGKITLQPTDIAGCFLMIAGGAGCLYKWFVL